MKPGDLVSVKRQLYWRIDRPVGVDTGCLALVLEVSDGLPTADLIDAQSWSGMSPSMGGVVSRLMIGGTPYLIRLKDTDVEVVDEAG